MCSIRSPSATELCEGESRISGKLDCHLARLMPSSRCGPTSGRLVVRQPLFRMLPHCGRARTAHRDRPDAPTHVMSDKKSEHAASENSTDLTGSERVRRHPRPRNRSAPQCGVSGGPRAYRVRVPIVPIQQPVESPRYSRFRRSSETRKDNRVGFEQASQRYAHCQAFW